MALPQGLSLRRCQKTWGECQGAKEQGGKEQCKICSLFSLTSNPVFLPERVSAAGCSWKAFAICPDCSRSCSCTYRVTGVVRCPSHSPCVSFLCFCGAWLPLSTSSALYGERKSSPSATGVQSKNHIKITFACFKQMEPKEKTKEEGGKARQGEERMNRDFLKTEGSA